MPWKPEGGKGPASKVRHLSPAMKLALKAIAMGAVKTNKDAAVISGLHPAYIGQMKNVQLGKDFMASQEGKLDEKIIETSALMEMLGREALMKMAGLMRFSNDEHVIAKAAADIMDRAPTTSKVHKAQIESFTLSGRDVNALASAMVESAKERQKFMEAAEGDFVRVAPEDKLSGPEGERGRISAGAEGVLGQATG